MLYTIRELFSEVVERTRRSGRRGSGRVREVENEKDTTRTRTQARVPTRHAGDFSDRVVLNLVGNRAPRTRIYVYT